MKLFNYYLVMLVLFCGIHAQKPTPSLKGYLTTSSEYVIEKWQRFIDWVKNTYDRIVHPYPAPTTESDSAQSLPPVEQIP
jgi:hypothetical protein